MLVFVYDGSFEGILSAVYDCYYEKKQPQKLLPQLNLSINMFEEYQYISTDYDKSDRVYNAIINKISSSVLEKIYNVYLSESLDAGTLILKYLQLAFKIGAGIENHLHDDNVLKVDNISMKVVREVHRMQGLLRFSRLQDGSFYAKYEPDYNITMLLSPHFKDRLSDQNWIIHDIKRNTAAIFNRQDFIIAQLEINKTLPLSHCEKFFQSVWKEYFANIAIAERKNPRLQKNYMPVRYWKNLVEMKG